MKRNANRAGFTLVEILIVVLIIALLALLVIPNFADAREKARRGRCLDNLRQINGAAQQYFLENTATSVAVTGLTQYFQTGNVPVCPGGGTYSATITSTALPTCNYSNAGYTHVLE